MAKNVTVQGASYTGVPALELPQTGGGTARFTDTSGVTATVSDVASGKIFVDANGELQTGTASGGVTGEVLWANWGMDAATYDRNGTPLVTDLSITIPTAGTYKIKSFLRNTLTSTWYASNARFYKNGVAVGSQHNIPAATSVLIEETITCSAGDTIVLYANSAYSTTYLTFYYGLFVCPA